VPGPSTALIRLGFAPMRMRRACTDDGTGPTGTADSTRRTRADEASAHWRRPISLLAEVPIAAGARGIRPVPAKVHRRRHRHSVGGNDAAKHDAVEAATVVRLLNPRPDRSRDFERIRRHGRPLGGRHMSPSGCHGNLGLLGWDGDVGLPGLDGSRSNRNLTGPDCHTPMCACDAMSSNSDAAMANREAAGCGATSA
jgi:hypothetical protein